EHFTNRTALHCAVSMHADGQDDRMLDLLVGGGADLEARDYKGETPLHLAVKGDKKHGMGYVNWLLDHGAVVDARDDKGVTPLHVAAYIGTYFIIYLLCLHGADVMVKDLDGRT
ncbi:ankyrin repeat-containing domain protein, partial [Baffinella frigidus]